MALTFISILSALSPFALSRENHISSVTAITEVFGEGQKITAVAVEYDKDINAASLTTSSFSVADRSITRVYTNTAATKAPQGSKGPFVIIELALNDANADTFSQEKGKIYRSAAEVNVKQLETIKTTRGKKYQPFADYIPSDKVNNLIVDDFQHLVYQDIKTGKSLRYNLYVPKNYDPAKSYPLVFFGHDTGMTSTDTMTTLIQGLGATVWASPAEQAKHESFVLAPQYDNQIVNDQSESTDSLDMTVDLINMLVNQYSIDSNRLYATGQSGGCMLSIAMSIKYPDLFAGLFLVAGQWDTEAMKTIAHKNMWIVVSQGDAKAYPGMNAGTAAMEEAGGTVSRAVWSGVASADEIATDAAKMIAEGNNIKYVALLKGTVVPEGQTDDPGSNHVNT